MNRPEIPAATAARASTGTNSRCPPETVPCPPGNACLLGRCRLIYCGFAGCVCRNEADCPGDDLLCVDGALVCEARPDSLWSNVSSIGGELLKSCGQEPPSADAAAC